MKKIGIFTVILFSVLSTGLFIYGFGSAINEVLDPSRVVEAPAEAGTGENEEDVQPERDEYSVFQVVALGDSLTRGIGDSRGLGYVGRLKQYLQETVDEQVSVSNLAVSGAETADLLEQLEKKGVQYMLEQADIIVMTIGGNDLNPGWDQLDQVDFAHYGENIGGLRGNAVKILEKIRAINQHAPIYWIGLYSPFEKISGLEESSSVVTEWNATLQKVLLEQDDRAYLIPMFDLFQHRTDELLYSDYFHPNSDGYEAITARLIQRLSVDGFGSNDDGKGGSSQ